MTEERRVLILIVEADPYIQALQAELLVSWGFQAVFAADGEQAVTMAHQLVPQLMIADILVPKIDGLQVCRRLKHDPQTAHVKVLIFSELLAERRAMEAGADAFLRKPLDKRVFFSVVRQLLSIQEQESKEAIRG